MLVKVLVGIIIVETIALIILIACLISKTRENDRNRRQLHWYNISSRYS